MFAFRRITNYQINIFNYFFLNTTTRNKIYSIPHCHFKRETLINHEPVKIKTKHFLNPRT